MGRRAPLQVNSSSESGGMVQESKSHQTPITTMQDTLRRRWSKVARTTRDVDQSPLSDIHPHMLPNVHRFTGPTKLDQDGAGKKTGERRQNGKMTSDISKVRDVDGSRANGDTSSPATFGRHSAARKQLRNRGSLSTISPKSQTKILPTRAKSIPDLQDKRKMQITRGEVAAMLASDGNPVSVESQRPAEVTLDSVRVTAHKAPSRVMVDNGTQTDKTLEFSGLSVQPESKKGSPVDPLKFEPETERNDLVQIKNLESGILEPSSFENPIFRSAYSADAIDLQSYHRYDMDDLRRVISTEVTLQWKNIKPSNTQELFRIHQNFTRVIQEMSSEYLRALLEKPEGETDWRGPHEILVPEHELLAKLFSRLYGLSSHHDLEIKPAGLLQLYLATVDYLHRGRQPKIGMDAMFLTAAFVERTDPKQIGDFAAISLPDVVFLYVPSLKLCEGEFAIFVPFYIGQNPFRLFEREVRTDFSTNLDWLTWCDETALFTGIIPRKSLRSSASTTYPLEITLKASVRFDSALKNQDSAPTVEKHIQSKMCFTIHKKVPDVTKANDGATLSANLPTMEPEQKQTGASASQDTQTTEVNAILSDIAMLKRARRCATMSMKLFKLARKYSEAAVDFADMWHAASGLSSSHTVDKVAPNTYQPRKTSGTAISKTEEEDYLDLVYWAAALADFDLNDDQKTSEKGSRPSSPVCQSPIDSAFGSCSSREQSPLVTKAHTADPIASDENERKPRSGSVTDTALGETRHDGVNSQLRTPSSSPDELPNKSHAETHQYFHPLCASEMALIDQVECYKGHPASTTMNKEPNHRASQYRPQMLKPMASQRKRKEKARKAKTRASPGHGNVRRKAPGLSPLSREVDCTWDLDDYANEISWKTDGAGASLASPSKIHPELGYLDAVNPEVKLSDEEARQLAMAIDLSLREKNAREMEKKTEQGGFTIPENWDDIFDVVSPKEEWGE